MTTQKQFEQQWREFRDLNKQIRENIKLMSKQKNKLLSKRKDDQKKAKQEVERLYNETCSIFVYLKSLQQRSLTRREESQNKLKTLCQDVDQQSLGIKNFEYEKVDIMKHIAICDDYKSNTNEPKLVSKKIFYQNNPQSKISDPHVEKTKRLEYELKQRKQFRNIQIFKYSNIH